MYLALRTRLLSNPALRLLGSFLLLTLSAASATGAGTWSTTGSMTVTRLFHTATLLGDGRVLVAGGCNDPDYCIPSPASAEIYDPTTGTWSATARMKIARDQHTATLLRDGRVLVAGGFGTNGREGHIRANAELYDPTAGTWSATGSMSVVRIAHTATLLVGGRVLVAGGGNGVDIVASAEVYNPTTRTWSATRRMSVARSGHRATLLTDGTVLVAGGVGRGAGGEILASAEIYHPTTGTWSTTGRMSVARDGHTATLLRDGRVLVAGGCDAAADVGRTRAAIVGRSEGYHSMTGS